MHDKKDNDEHEDIVLEEEIVEDESEFENASADAKNAQKIKKLRTELAEVQKEKIKFHEELQRARADFLNSKRRLEDQLASDRERATDRLLLEFLTLSDSFDTAKSDKEAWNTVEEKWRIGVDAIHAKLSSILNQYNVIEMNPLGETFDPSQHEAILNVHVDDKKQVNKIIEVIQKGYKKNNTIIRPARVIVGTQ